MQFELKQIQGKVIQIYPEAFKRMVIEEYLNNPSVYKMDLLRKYGIRTKSGIQRWMKRLGYKDDVPREKIKRPSFKFTIQSPFALMKKTDVTKLSLEELQRKVQQLEKQLEDERLRCEGYARIIEIAEKELKLPIRKKPGTR